MTEDAIHGNEIDSEIFDSSKEGSPVERQNLPFSQLAGGPINNGLHTGKLERS
jgi:hypothetical protein